MLMASCKCRKYCKRQRYLEHGTAETADIAAARALKCNIRGPGMRYKQHWCAHFRDACIQRQSTCMQKEGHSYTILGALACRHQGPLHAVVGALHVGHFCVQVCCLSRCLAGCRAPCCQLHLLNDRCMASGEQQHTAYATCQQGHQGLHQLHRWFWRFTLWTLKACSTNMMKAPNNSALHCRPHCNALHNSLWNHC